MSSQQQGIIQDEPLKVLGLFHKRDQSTITFNEDKFLKLHDSLCCTICRQLFNNPVYLRCSHRFCKQCIEKYIRFNDKKSCPNCRGDLNTKRDLRTDYNLTTLIRYAYGDRQKFIEDMTQIQNAQAINLQRSNSKSSAIVRTKSFAQEEQKVVKKKVKLNETINIDQMNQQKSKKRKTNNKSQGSSKLVQESSRTQQIRTEMFQNIIIGQKPLRPFEEEPLVKIEKMQLQKSSHNVEQPPIKTQLGQIVKIKKKRGRKKQIPIVEVKSQSQQEQQPIEHTPMQLEQKPEPIKKQYRPQSFIQLKDKPCQKNIQEIQTRYDSFQKERKLLKEEFGDNYMLSLMKVPTIDFLIEIKIQRYPHCFLTPMISCKSIQLSSKTKLHNVFLLMSKLLNLPLKNINMFVNSQKITPLPYYLYKDKSIGQINEDIWKSTSEIQVFDMKEILSSLQDVRGEGNKQHESRQNNQKKKLFEGIQFEREQRLTQPKKRGRGRWKKTQEKQNTIETKDQVKRIFYYRIVTE